MAIWINTGTVSISAGGTTVTGVGTSFLTGGTQKGDMFQAPDGREYEITNIVSDTQLTIFKAYQGTNVSGSSNWDIIPTQGYVKALVDEVREFVETNNTIVNEISTTGLSITHGGTGATTASGARANLGLGNVDNTSDANKPISAATQTALDGKLGLTATAADSAKLGGVAPDGYVKKTDISGLVGNLSAPLLHLPLKKNLLTQQGQSVCTFTRASAATYVDRYGMLKSVAADIPRFTADGLLIEGASTNLFTYSEQFDNAAWNKSECSVSANSAATTDPFGTSLADKIVESTVNSKHQIYYAGISFTSGTAYTFSVYAKAAERTGILLSLPSAVFGTSEAFFDLTAGTASGTGAAISKLANGWFRCSITKTATASASSAVYAMPTSGGVAAYTGDGASGLYVFGAQLEAMPFMTSYIATTTASATRAYNNCYITPADNVPYYSSDFSLAVDILPAGLPAYATYFAGDGGFYLGFNSTRTMRAVFGSLPLSGSTVYTAGTKLRVVAIKAASILSVYVNGTLAMTGTVGTIPVNTANFYIGSTNSGSTNLFFGSISNLRFYDRALTAEEVRLA